MTGTTRAPRALRAALALVAAGAGLALAGCNQGNPGTDPNAVSAGTVLDDSIITNKVKNALLTQTGGKGSDTSVDTRKGEVVLSGFVDDQAQADKEVELAKAVQGVRSVDNKLMVRNGSPTAGNQLDDSVITVKVKSALMADDATRGSAINVSTSKGVVQLSGFVDNAAEQARAAELARKVDGVRSVVDDTTLKH